MSELKTVGIKELKNNPEIYTDLQRKSERLTTAINQFLQQGDYPAQLLSADSMFHLVFQREPVERGKAINPETLQLEHRYYAHLLKRGVIVPGIHLFFLSAAHSDAMTESFKAIRNEGLI